MTTAARSRAACARIGSSTHHAASFTARAPRARLGSSPANTYSDIVFVPGYAKDKAPYGR
ncbi:hypothetical protein ACWKT5_24690 [Streptomyces avermitilis]